MSKAGRISIFLTPFVIVAGLFIVKAVDRNLYWRIFGMEDGPIENLTSILYIVAAVIALLTARRFHREAQMLAAILCVVMGAGFLVIAMEEISWAQRILGIVSPEFFEKYNMQHETNIHNLLHRNWLHLIYVAVAIYGMSAFLFVPKLMDRLFGGRFSNLASLISPPWFLTSFFAPILFIYIYYEIDEILARRFGSVFLMEQGAGTRSIFIISDQEPMECILSLGFLLFIFMIYRSLDGVGRRYAGPVIRRAPRLGANAAPSL